MAPNDYREWNRSKMSRTPGRGRDGNVVLLAIAGVALIILIGFGLPRLLQRREPGLEGAPATAAHDETAPAVKKKRASVFEDEAEPEAPSHAEHEGGHHGKEKAEHAKAAHAKSSTHEGEEVAHHGGGLAESEEDHAAPVLHSARYRKPASHASKSAGHGSGVSGHGEAEGTGDFCGSVEEPGRPAEDIKLTQKAWMPLVEDFRAAKRGVVDWMKAHPAQFPTEKMETLAAKIMDLQIQRPPTMDEPDLAWRGGVVLSRMPDGKQLLRVGGGFLAFHQKDRARARFEMARAVSMLLSPCELGKTELAGTWDKTLACTSGYQSESCEVGSFSNQAWLVASSVAYEAQSPGCKIRAVEKSGFLGCLSGGAPVASQGGHHEETDAQARVPVGVAAIARDIASSAHAPAVKIAHDEHKTEAKHDGHHAKVEPKHDDHHAKAEAKHDDHHAKPATKKAAHGKSEPHASETHHESDRDPASHGEAHSDDHHGGGH